MTLFILALATYIVVGAFGGISSPDSEVWIVRRRD